MTIRYLCAPEDPELFRNAALVVGHPGHELRVFGWASKYKPRTYVLTDGSGHGTVSRVSSTRKVLDDLGASCGEVFGIVSDAKFYTLVLSQKSEFFLEIVERLANCFLKHGITAVAADEVEGYNPAHDLCRAITEGAITLAQRRSSHRITDYAFRLTDGPVPQEDNHDHRCLHLELDEELLQKKLQAARQYTELRSEVDRALAKQGAEHFKRECLRKVTESFQGWPGSYKPYYETYGERQVAQGLYHSVVRYEEHVAPLVREIRRYAASHAAGKKAVDCA